MLRQPARTKPVAYFKQTLLALAVLGVTTPYVHAEDRQKLISGFPTDVQPLITADVPDALIASLLKLRKADPGTLVFANSGGERAEGQRKAFIENWEKLTGWRVKDQSPALDPGPLKALVDAGSVQVDLIENGSVGDAIGEEQLGLLEPLDSNLLDPIFATFPKDGGYRHSKYWVQSGWYGVVLLWDKRKWPESGVHPTTPNDLFDTAKFPGKRCLYKYPEYAGTLEYPLLADGIEPQKLYPLDVERALKKLGTIRNDTVWWSNPSDSVQNIVSGNCVLGVTWHGRAAARLKEDPSLPLGVSWNGTLLIDDAWAIPKGARHAEAADTLLGYAFTAGSQARLLNSLGYGIPIDPTLLDDNGRKWGVTLDNVKLSAAKQDPDYYSKNGKQVVSRFNAWLAE